MTKRLFSLLTLCLAACSNSISPPSLMPRAVEKQDGSKPKVVIPVNGAPASPALKSQIATALAKVKAGDKVFSETDAKNGRLIAVGRRASEGSEAWVVGQQAQSALETARQDSAAALAEIENLLLAQTQAAAGDPTVGGIAELTAAESEASEIVARQTDRLKDLMR